jgi:hypothetical protein
MHVRIYTKSSHFLTKAPIYINDLIIYVEIYIFKQI